MGVVNILLKFCTIAILIEYGFGYSLGISNSLHCAVRKQISPCTCLVQEPSNRRSTKSIITVTCEGMVNFQQVVTALTKKFDIDVDISLKISHSVLEDLPQLSFEKLNLTIHILKLNFDNLRSLPVSVFSGLSKTESFSLADNNIPMIPEAILNTMPKIKVLDLSRGHILNVSTTNFQALESMHTLVINENNIELLEKDCFPKTLRKLSLTFNKIKHLNGTLRGLSYLQWLLLNDNEIEDLEGQLPQVNPNLKLILLNLANNKLLKLPQELRNFLHLENLYLEYNKLESLDRALSKSKHLKSLVLSANNISKLYSDDFLELEYLEELQFGENNIATLNNCLLPLKSLKHLNLSHNNIQEFTLQDIRGLTKLNLVDLSNNKIHVLSGRMENLVELETRVYELRLDYNKLQTLSGSLMGFSSLHRLNLSNNYIDRILPDDLIGLDDLQILDISHNNLTTLEETSKTVLPSLEELIASYNSVTRLEKDFYGLPRLCWADLSHNQITYISKSLVDNTQCKLYEVPSILRIYLHGNPSLCEPEVVANIIDLESKNNTKIHGRNECPPQEKGRH
ncbi:chaoptin [Cimex lectularius]|uniref:Uncharacterized protein n=1 Tax=Cimex lectularius TaxID=79782 RepID=A0A8I6TE50_CIMLE|nr:chaoptin [Cimex lectularius]